MPPSLLSTKLYIPQPRPQMVPRPRLVKQLNEGLQRKLTLISAPAGFGKTTLLSEWIAACSLPAAWLSLDEGDNDPARFMVYFVAALRSLARDQSGIFSPVLGEGLLRALQSPQLPPLESILTALINELAAVPEHFILVLDDYHLIETPSIDEALAFLIKHLPPQMHLVMATREDPGLPLARLRAQSGLTELRVTDLRFSLAEAADFLNQAMGLNLAAEDIAALETRTEGWITGLQLAAISMQGQKDVGGFIRSFTGSHHFVLDYLVEEVLQQQPANVQSFLLHTSILDRLCGPLCDAVWPDPDISGQDTLEMIQRANLFIVPLDNERRWYRYHHLFADLLRQRLHQNAAPAADGGLCAPQELHRRASLWYENNGLEMEAFHHAAAACDIDLAARLLEGKGMPLHFRGAVVPVLNWLASLPIAELDARPSLWVMYASAQSMTGKLAGVETKLQAAEAALQGAGSDARTRNLTGHIAAIRALLAAGQNDVGAIIAQSQRALEYLHPDNLPVRTATIWKMGIAYHIQGDRPAARKAYEEAVAISQATGNAIIHLSAAIGLGSLQEMDNQLFQALEIYQQVLQMAGDPPPPMISEALLGLARIRYEWNDLEAARQTGEQGMAMSRLFEMSDRFIPHAFFETRLKLAEENLSGAAATLTQAHALIQQHHLMHRMPEWISLQTRVLLCQGNPSEAARLAGAYPFPINKARVHLAQHEPARALAELEPLRQQMAAKGWADEQLKVSLLQALAFHEHGERNEALNLLEEVLGMARPGGFIRLFLDEGDPMAQLLMDGAVRGIQPEYTRTLLAAFGLASPEKSPPPIDRALVEPLSPRELEVLRLIAEGLSNQAICDRLFLALDTVKGHNQKIFAKLQVQRRTEAVARARELGLL